MIIDTATISENKERFGLDAPTDDILLELIETSLQMYSSYMCTNTNR
jgi:hypothetical protein